MKERDLLTPIGACVLFGKSGEAVRRAIKEKLVDVPVVLPFNTKQTIPLIDLESARRYWLRHPRPSYYGNLERQLNEMRVNGMTIYQSAALSHFRVLHPYALMEGSAAVDQLHDED